MILAPDSRPSHSNRNSQIEPLWSFLQSIPGARALPTTWRHLLETDFPCFKAAFLRSCDDQPARFVPCPFRCGCHHEVFKRDNGTLGGECRCKSRACDTYTVLPDEIIPLELDLVETGRAICEALSIPCKITKLGLYNFIQISSWSADATPIIFCVAYNQPELLNTIGLLVSRFGRPFALLAPSTKFLDTAAKTLLGNINAQFISLEAHITISDSGQLRAHTTPKQLFAPLISFLPETTDEQRASRICTVLDKDDRSKTHLHPNFRTIYELCCVQGLPVRKVARKCRCSIGTISNRLQLLQQLTSSTLDQLRGLSDIVNEFEESLAAAKAEHLTIKRRPK